MALELTPGDWLMFESSEPNVQPFWIGNKAISKTEWKDKCWYKNETNRRQKLIGDLPLDSGEYAINVQWYKQRDISSPCEYVVSREYPYPINHNSTLLLVGFDMILSVGNAARVP